MPARVPTSIPGIYAIINTVSGKRYIGSTVNIRKRWEIHRLQLSRGTHHCQHLQRAWVKYGAQSFRWEVLEEVADLDRLIEREQSWIDATPKAERYNTSPTASSIRGYVQPPEVRRKHAVSWLGKHLSPEHNAKFQEGNRNKRMPESARKAIGDALRGRKRPPEVGRKISAGKKGQPFTEAHKQALSAAKMGKPWTEAQRQASLRPGWARKPRVKADQEA